MKKMYIAILSEFHMGYSAGSQIVYIEDETRFCLAIDKNDEFCGFFLHTNRRPKLTDATFVREIDESAFYMIYNWIQKSALRLSRYEFDEFIKYS